MGRGNVCVFGKYEGLYYVDYDYLPEDDYGYEGEYTMGEILESFMRKFKSFSAPFSRIYIRDGEVRLESSLFYVVFEDNEWSLAVKLVQKDCDFNAEPLQKRYYQKYLDGLKDCLFEQFDELGIYAGTWTHGTIKSPALLEQEKQKLIEEGQKEQAKKSFYED